MSESSSRGRFVWFDLMTTDPTQAIEFYTRVAGWSTAPWEGAVPYTMWTGPGGPIGGVMQLPPEAGAPPHWLAYVSSPDTDATVAQAEALGAKTLVVPRDIPNVGRFAVVADPQGATFAVFTPSLPATPDRAPKPGEFSWHELATTDHPAAFRFYERLFGWTPLNVADIGEMGTYQLFGSNDREVGGMFNQPPTMPGPPAWLHYVMVEDLERAAEATRANGGR